MRSGLLAVVVPLILGVVPACGGTPSQLTTTIAAKQDAAVKPGDTPEYVVTVTNKGPNSAPGVTIHIDLPAQFRYKATRSSDLTYGGARTQELDPAVNSPSPEWGLWSLAAPTPKPDGSESESRLQLTFSVDAEGPPGNYQVTARAAGDSTESDSQAPTIAVQLQSAPHLSMNVTASPADVHKNDLVTYKVAVTNDGSGNAGGLQLLVTLPAGFAFEQTTHIDGNFARENTKDPDKRAALVYYGDFTVPARSDAGPGILTVTFTARALPAVSTGSWPVTAQATDANGDQVVVANTVPVNVS